MKKLTNRPGFTLVELMAFLAIAMILLVIIIVGIQLALRAFRNTNRENDATNVQKALNEYFGHHQSFPDAVTGGFPTINMISPDGTTDTDVEMQQGGLTVVNGNDTCTGDTTTDSDSWIMCYIPEGNPATGYTLLVTQENGPVKDFSAQ